ncbi:MAG: CPBP family intramembrane metalloprotease [Clostridia bacterium]|nr:CPBP family intramembrane metalloprotease [Clostridia bacterium]
MDNFGSTEFNYSPQDVFFAEYKEKTQLRRKAWAIAVPAIAFFIISQYWAKIVLLAGARFGLTAEKLRLFFSEPAVLQIAQIILSLFLFTVPFVICAMISGEKISEIAGLRKPKSNRLAYFLFGVGFCSFANIAVSQMSRIFDLFGINYSVPEDKNPEGVFGFILVLISTVIVPAIVEEFSMRGIVIGLLKPFGSSFAIFASAAVFGLIHGNFNQIPFAFMVGLVLGFIRIKTDSLVICMAVHGLNNLIAVITSYAESLPANIRNTIYTVYIMLALTFAILGVALIKEKNAFSLKRPETVMSTKKICVNYFFSPATLIVFALFFYRACTYIFY